MAQHQRSKPTTPRVTTSLFAVASVERDPAPWRSSALAFAAGALWGLFWFFPGFAPALPLAFVILLVAFDGARSWQDAVRIGACAGIAKYISAAHFLLALLRFSPLAVMFYVLAICYIVPFTAFSFWVAFWLERRTRVPRGCVLLLMFPLAEKLRTLGDLALPVDLTSHAFGANRTWLAWTPWTGPFGMTLWCLGVGWLAYRTLMARRQWRVALAWGVAALVVWAAPRLTHRESPALPSTEQGAHFNVAVVQPVLTLEEKSRTQDSPELWQRLERLTLERAAAADLVIWPETSRPGTLFWDERGPLHDEAVEAIARRAGVPILYGCLLARVRDRRPVALYNGAVLVHPDGSAAEWYGKRELLPFVEGMPLGDVFGYDPSKNAGRPTSWLTLLGNFNRGPAGTIFKVGRARIGVMICYEGLFPDMARAYRQAGANLLVVMTNDLWWGNSGFAQWGARSMVSRAIEENLPLIRAANSGVSSVTQPSGRIAERSALNEVRVVDMDLDLGERAPTFYTRHGDWLVGLDLVAMLGLTGLGLWRRFGVKPVVASAGGRARETSRAAGAA